MDSVGWNNSGIIIIEFLRFMVTADEPVKNDQYEKCLFHDGF
jgi:hypothetical protein